MANFRINIGGITTNKEDMPAIDLRYGPFDSPEDAQEFLENDDLITTGLTVGIWNNAHTEVTEYWWQGGTTINHLVQRAKPSKLKRIFFLLAAMLLSCASAFAQSGNSEPIKGDVNGDGKVDVADIVSIIDIMKNNVEIILNPDTDQIIDGPQKVSAKVINGTSSNVSWNLSGSVSNYNIDNVLGSNTTVTPINYASPEANKGTISMTIGASSTDSNSGKRILNAAFTKGNVAIKQYEPVTLTASYPGAEAKAIKLTFRRTTEPLSAGNYTWYVVSGKTLPQNVTLSGSGSSALLINTSTSDVVIEAGTIQVVNTNGVGAAVNDATSVPAANAPVSSVTMYSFSTPQTSDYSSSSVMTELPKGSNVLITNRLKYHYIPSETSISVTREVYGPQGIETEEVGHYDSINRVYVIENDNLIDELIKYN